MDHIWNDSLGQRFCERCGLTEEGAGSGPCNPPTTFDPVPRERYGAGTDDSEA